MTGAVATFRRVVVTPEQIKWYDLPEAPPKPTDRRGTWTGGTVQAEALAPDDLAVELRRALEAVVDLDFLAGTLETEEEERRRLLERLDGEDWQ